MLTINTCIALTLQCSSQRRLEYKKHSKRVNHSADLTAMFRVSQPSRASYMFAATSFLFLDRTSAKSDPSRKQVV